MAAFAQQIGPSGCWGRWRARVVILLPLEHELVLIYFLHAGSVPQHSAVVGTFLEEQHHALVR